MKTKYSSIFGLLAVLLFIAFSFLLASPAPTNAEGTVNANNPAVAMPAMLSSPSSAFAPSPVNTESAVASWANVLGAIAAILLAGLTLLVLLATFLSPFVPFFRYIMHKLADISRHPDQDEVVTHYHVHRAGQPLSTSLSTS